MANAMRDRIDLLLSSRSGEAAVGTYCPVLV